MKVINRGGEIVSPLEVEEVVLAHPAAIAECVAFALLHALLGEAVTVCVVSRRPAVRHDADGGDEARAARASHRASTRSARTARSARARRFFLCLLFLFIFIINEQTPRTQKGP